MREANAVFILQTIEPPTVSFVNFHEETKLYTVMMIDPGKKLDIVGGRECTKRVVTIYHVGYYNSQSASSQNIRRVVDIQASTNIIFTRCPR